MKPKFFFILIIALAAVTLVGASAAQAQPAKQPKQMPIVPMTSVVQTATGLTGWCGKDFILLSQEQVGDRWRARLSRISNDPTDRAVRFFIYSASGKLIFTGINSAGGTKEKGVSAFVEKPGGFWTTYAWTAEVVYEPAPGPGTLVVMIRQAKQDCLLTRVLFTGKG